MWKPGGLSGATDTKAQRIITDCGMQHENDHHNDIDCPKIWCRGFPTRPPFKKGSNPDAEECSAYKKELNCLQRRIQDCGGNIACEDQVNDEIALVLAKMIFHHCTK
jgi:hypothetical protein